MKISCPLLTILFCTAVSLLSGCTPVRAWERGNFAKPQMALESYPLRSALSKHNYVSREAASGGGMATGGGCGCY